MKMKVEFLSLLPYQRFLIKHPFFWFTDKFPTKFFLKKRNLLYLIMIYSVAENINNNKIKDSALSLLFLPEFKSFFFYLSYR